VRVSSLRSRFVVGCVEGGARASSHLQADSVAMWGPTPHCPETQNRPQPTAGVDSLLTTTRPSQDTPITSFVPLRVCNTLRMPS
jgi:hypothetical protein